MVSINMHPLALITQATSVASIITTKSMNNAAAPSVDYGGSMPLPKPNDNISKVDVGVSQQPITLDEDTYKPISAPSSSGTATHFCFIVHGHQGRPTDLSYVHHALKAKANEHGTFVDVKSSNSCTVGKHGRGEEGTGVVKNNEQQKAQRRKKRDRLPFIKSRHKGTNASAVENRVKESTTVNTHGTLIVHNAACNEGKTNDGIIKGGERLVNEMLDVIRNEVPEKGHDVAAQQGPVDVTISIVGNSLGGLYGRYAIAHLAEVCKVIQVDEKEKNNNETCTAYVLDDYIHIHFNVFCSTASPHLGCASHTYIPLPRAAELGVAQLLGETGSDLFRCNDLLHRMATSEQFKKPLASFQRRIAYANAYKTDFPVPCATAAFLDINNDYPHYFSECNKQNADEKERTDYVCPASNRGLIAATLHTPRMELGRGDIQTETNQDDLAAMSSSLDALGWKKVFIDMRKEVVSLPSIFKSDDNPISRLKSSSNAAVKSCDLMKAISTTSSLNLPLGHNAICAFERGTVRTAVNSGGRPVMDSLAIDLANEISMWNRMN